ncbi:MAG: conjugative relaxase [Acidobacteria bacterium]|nr:conjugative relaxase [Acidobacteriota bacterium]
MVASIDAVASPAQGVSYYEKDSYHAKDSDVHRAASAWAGKGAAELGLQGPVDPDTFRVVLEGEIPDGSGKRLGKRGKEGEIHHRPGRDLTSSAPESVSLAALIGGDERIVEAHGRAVAGTFDWFERNAAETRMQDPTGGRMVRAGGQKTVIATFRHDTSRNLDPARHTHSVIADMLLGPDGKWRTMANERLYALKMALGALYRNALAGELGKLGYRIEKTHADGRFEIAGVSRETVEAFSTRRTEIEAAMEGRGLGTMGENPHLARRAALMTRATKREVDRDALREIWERQATALGFDAKGLVAEATERHGAEKARDAETVKDASPAPPRQPDCSSMPRKRTPRARRWTGRWPISRSATRYSPRPTCSRPRSPSNPARPPSAISSAPWTASSAWAVCMTRPHWRAAAVSLPTRRWRRSARRSRRCAAGWSSGTCAKVCSPPGRNRR